MNQFKLKERASAWHRSKGLDISLADDMPDLHEEAFIAGFELARGDIESMERANANYRKIIAIDSARIRWQASMLERAKVIIFSDMGEQKASHPDLNWLDDLEKGPPK